MNTSTRHMWIPVGMLLASWGLLLAGLAQQSMWIDEWFTLYDISPAWNTFLPTLIAAERRPPLYWIMLKTWLEAVGQSEWAMRCFSVSATMLAIAVSFALARKLAGDRTGLIAAGLVAFSPFLLLYGRMMRSYTLFAALAGFTTWAVLRLDARVTRGHWLVYVGLAIALLYSDYGAWAVLGTHMLWLLLKGQRLLADAGNKLRKLSALAAAGLAFVPWLSILMQQSTRDLIRADLSSGGLGLALKLIFPFASLGAGETLYPWHPLAVISISTCGLLATIGCVRSIRQRAEYGWLVTAWFALSITFTATLFSTVAPDITFLNMVSRTPHLVIAYSILVATGLVAIKSIRWRIAAVSLIGATFALAIFNYYTGREFHNPIYAIPIRQIAEQVKAQSTPDDLIIADGDTIFGYYYEADPGAATLQTTDLAANRRTIEAQHPARVWLITFGRDRTATTSDADALTAWLASNYAERSQQGYGAVEPSYRWIKEHLLDRPAYAYKLTITVYERKR